MTRKQWALLSLTLLFSGIASTIGLVCIVDPFEVYRPATAFIPPIANGTQNYANAGVAKSYDYDSIIIGSSMTENFTPSQLDRLLGGRFVKLPIFGGSPYNNKQMMDMAFGSQDIAHVFYGLDIESFTWFYTTPKCEMPDYLYDDNLFNDTAYWFNSSVLLTYIPACLKTLGQNDPNLRDTMYSWGNLYPYGKEYALQGIDITGEHYPQREVSQEIVLSQQSLLNAEHNILAYIKAHPQTQFTFFFPPYALVNWYKFYQMGDFEYHLIQKEALTAELLLYENVKVYDFQAELDWILNLDHYIDSSHYGPWINDAIVEAIARDDYRVTDIQTIRVNNQVLRDHIALLTEYGAWPDTFPGLIKQ